MVESPLFHSKGTPYPATIRVPNPLI